MSTFLKFLKNCFVIAALISTASLAVAAPSIEDMLSNNDLKIANSSKNKLSFHVEGVCSSEIGIVEPHEIKIISHQNLVKACKKNSLQCNASIYPSEHCSGSPIAELVINTNEGVNKIIVFSSEYKIQAKQFNLFVDGPWMN